MLSRAGRLSVHAASGPWRPSPHLGHLLCPGGRQSGRRACATQRGVVRHRCFSEDLGGEGAPSEAASFLVFIFLRWERGEPGGRGSLRDESGREPEGTGGVTPGDGERPLAPGERKPQRGLRRSFLGFCPRGTAGAPSGWGRAGSDRGGRGRCGVRERSGSRGAVRSRGAVWELGRGPGVGEQSGSWGEVWECWLLTKAERQPALFHAEASRPRGLRDGPGAEGALSMGQGTREAGSPSQRRWMRPRKCSPRF